jgi:hypothetical protein
MWYGQAHAPPPVQAARAPVGVAVHDAGISTFRALGACAGTTCVGQRNGITTLPALAHAVLTGRLDATEDMGATWRVQVSVGSREVADATLAPGGSSLRVDLGDLAAGTYAVSIRPVGVAGPRAAGTLTWAVDAAAP